jgi:hypothetical protein
MQELTTNDINKIKTILRKIDPMQNQNAALESLLALALKQLHEDNTRLERRLQQVEQKLKRTNKT